MILVQENNNLLNEVEKKYLENICNNFVIHESPSPKKDENFYFRHIIKTDNTITKNIANKIYNNLNININSLSIKLLSITINKVDKDSNKNDYYHMDECDFTFILYLNENFKGGEFEYFDENNKVKKINPKKYLSILTSKEIKHRVCSVKSGIRYSLVFFYNIEKKQVKSLI